MILKFMSSDFKKNYNQIIQKKVESTKNEMILQNIKEAKNEK